MLYTPPPWRLLFGLIQLNAFAHRHIRANCSCVSTQIEFMLRKTRVNYSEITKQTLHQWLSCPLLIWCTHRHRLLHSLLDHIQRSLNTFRCPSHGNRPFCTQTHIKKFSAMDGAEV